NAMTRFPPLPPVMVAILSTLCVPLSAVASDAVLQVPDVVVSATRSERSDVPTPAAISVIGRDEIEASGATSVADLLRARSGLVVTDLFGDGRNTSVGMRGFSESAHSNTLILVDGRRLNNGDIGSPDLSQVHIRDIERVEIIQGGAGTLFGDQAVGGVINIITRRPQDLNGRISVGVDGFGGTRLEASVEDRFDSGLAARVSMGVKESDNYRDHNRLESDKLFARLEYAHDYGLVFAEILRSDEDLQTPGALTAAQIAVNRQQAAPGQTTDFSDTETAVERVGLEWDLNDSWTLATEATQSDADNTFVAFGGAGRQDRNQKSLNPRLIGAIPFNGDELLLTAGADLEEARYRIASAFTNRDNSLDNRSLYAQLTVPVARDWSVTGGIRHARQDNQITDALTSPGGQDFDFEETVGELGVSHQWSPTWRLFGRVDQNFRFPKIDEQAFTSPGNVLRNQTGESWEAGAEWREGVNRFAVNLYRLNLEDEIAFDPTATAPPGSFFAGANVNFDPTRHQGVVIEGDTVLFERLTLAASYAYTDARFLSGVNQDRHISYVPSNSARVSGDYRFTDALSLYGEMLFTGERHVSGDNANAAPSADSDTVFNLNLRYRLGDLTLSAKLNNALDEKYEGFETAFGAFPAPERNVAFEMEWALR
ncbi:MAG: TonB-dependent receptor, partial [Gammaproteobacteria bacterium]